MRLERKLTQWLNCDPKSMVEQLSKQALIFALQDARSDILILSRLLIQAGYPKRGTSEETQDIFEFSEKVQKLISHEEAVELS